MLRPWPRTGATEGACFRKSGNASSGRAMARLRYITPADSPDPERMERVYSQIRGMGRRVNHLYQVLANQPAALEAFLGMSRYIRDDSSLRPALREMAILATAEALHQPYETAHHRPAALQAGVTPGKIDTLLAA